MAPYRGAFLVISSVLVLLAASPAISWYLVLPRTEFFTELWLLGPNHMAEDYPFNITAGAEYQVVLGIGNWLGEATYYRVAVKFRNETQPAADSFNRTPSSLPLLYEIQAFVADEGVWELPMTFAFEYDYYAGQRSVTVNSLMVNGVELPITDCSLAWNVEQEGNFGQLFLELWIYNTTRNQVQYHERFVGLWLNMTII